MLFETTEARPSILPLKPSLEERPIIVMTQESAAEQLGAHGAGGASTTALHTTQGLYELGFDPTLITPSPRTPDGKLPYNTNFYDLGALARQIGVEDPDTLSSDTLLSIYSRPEVAEMLGDVIASGDLLHAHFYTTKGLLEHLPTDTPVVYYHHSPFTRVRQMYDPSMVDGSTNAAKTSTIRTDAEQWLLTHMDAIVFFTEAEAQLTRQQYPEIDLGGRLHVIPLGIDMNRFNPGVRARLRHDARAQFGIPQNAKVIYMQARVGKSQGQLLLAQAFQEDMMDADPNLHLVIVGGPARGEAAYMEELQAIATKYPGRITLTGAIPPEVGHAIGDICVGFKLETFGFANLEAMAMGNALIVQDNDMHQEVYGNKGGVGYINIRRLNTPGQRKLLSRMILDDKFRDRATVLNPQHASQYTWARTRALLARLTGEVQMAAADRDYRRRTGAEIADLIVERGGKRNKIIALTDYDGTAANQLLPEAQRLGSTAPARKALMALRSKGIPTGVITSRSLGEALQISDVLATNGISVAENGAVIALPAGAKLANIPGAQIYEGRNVAVLSTVTTDTLRAFLAKVEQEARRRDPEGSRSLFSSFSPVHELQREAGHANIEDTIASTKRLGSAYAVKLTAVQQKVIEELAPHYDINALFDGTTVNLEGKNVSKGNALKFIREHSRQLFPNDGIDDVTFIGFGNHDNDISLWDAAIESGGVGVMVAHPNGKGRYFVNPSSIPNAVIKTVGAYGNGMVEAIPSILKILEERYNIRGLASI